MKVPAIVIFDSVIAPALIRPLNSSNPVRDRRETFRYVLQSLGSAESLIVETGCSRKDHGTLAWGDDGCSTFFFDFIVSKNGGRVESVDLNPDNVAHANYLTSKKVAVTCQDSVQFLTAFKDADQIDLLYLDSFDFDPINPVPSQKHHLEEITAIYDRLKTGCIILVDDAVIESVEGNLGKAKLVYDFLATKGIYPTVTSYQLLWIKS